MASHLASRRISAASLEMAARRDPGLQGFLQLCTSAGHVWPFRSSYRDLKTVWNLHGDYSFQKRDNIAPSQEVPVMIRNKDGGNEAAFVLARKDTNPPS
jgi:hypothetical protein